MDENRLEERRIQEKHQLFTEIAKSALEAGNQLGLSPDEQLSIVSQMLGFVSAGLCYRTDATEAEVVELRNRSWRVGWEQFQERRKTH